MAYDFRYAKRDTMTPQLGVVYLTGGSGSFGRAMIPHLLSPRNLGPTLAEKVVAVSRNAEMRYRLEQDFAPWIADGRLVVAPADVRNRADLDSSYDGQVDTIIHAAAEKHVTTGEKHAHYVNSINLDGAANVVWFAQQRGARRIVALSTDKACNPVNAYGQSKAAAEVLLTRLAQNSKSRSFSGGTDIVIIRYGNVAGSSGSVIPLFIKQLHGNRITVTDRRMTRFLMPLSPSSSFNVHAIVGDQQHRIISAVELATYAAIAGTHGEIIVPRIPSATVGDLANAIAATETRGCVVEEIGVRPGEKMHEDLVSLSEGLRTWYRADEGLYIIRPEWDVQPSMVDDRKCEQGFSYSSNDDPQPIAVQVLR